jgi:hypothetical protein
MNESKNTKRAGWLVAAGALILAGAISILGASHPASKSSAQKITTPSVAADVTPGPALADSDVLDLQLD